MKMIINSFELKSIMKNINNISKKRNIPELDRVKITVENTEAPASNYSHWIVAIRT